MEIIEGWFVAKACKILEVKYMAKMKNGRFKKAIEEVKEHFCLTTVFPGNILIGE